MKNEKVPKTVREKRFLGSKNGKLIRKGRRVDLKIQKMGHGKTNRENSRHTVFFEIWGGRFEALGDAGVKSEVKIWNNF